ncbi:hypothetical protein QR674_15705 [Acinetobacter chinensis]|uniref:Multidrug transporter n=1 Tax=Acinetobacter chinensis TaxID=2004650 RepID=A0ABU3WJ60_9GAMM|nr:hypothetical protein [Acinetobacter chinensis]MDV2470424.1 hypothetical protein [Acinetobacter chinensis]
MLKSFTEIKYRLLFFLLLGSAIPLLYSTTRIYWMGQMEDGVTFNIASQLTWVSVLYEIVNEALLLPLAFILGSVIKETERLKQRIAITLTVFVAVYLIITLAMLMFTPSAVGFMQQASSLTALTVQYIRLEAVAIFFPQYSVTISSCWF